MEHSTPPAVTVVILNWNGKAFLEAFLPSVVGSDYPDFEVLLVDNASTDGSVEWVRATCPGLRVLVLERNFGFAEGNNRAMPHVHSPYLVLLNSDVQVPPGWLWPLVRLAEANAAIAAIQPKILWQKQPQAFEYAGAGGGFIDILGYAFCRGRVLEVLEPDQGQFDTPRPIFWATGACMFLRKKVVDEIGLFDPDYFAHYEEIDFCWRAQNAGHQVWVQPQSMVYHVGGGTLPQGSPRKTYLNFRNSLLTLYKNLPASERWWKLPARQLLDYVAAGVEMAKGRRNIAAAILRSHAGFRKLKPAARLRRMPLPQKPMARLQGVFLGMMLWQYYIKGRKHFRNFPPRRFSP